MSMSQAIGSGSFSSGGLGASLPRSGSMQGQQPVLGQGGSFGNRGAVAAAVYACAV